jgi:diacylglycerol kinase family enzyme
MPSEKAPRYLDSPVERIVVLENPITKNGPRGHRQLKDLLDYSDLPYDTVTTDHDPLVTADRLRSALEPTDLLYIIGGDGTANCAIAPTLSADALILPTRSGNANDLAMSLNGRRAPWRTYAESITQNGIESVSIRPIIVTIDDEKSQQQKYALNYTSIGYAALASVYLNQPWSSPTLKQVYTTLPNRVQNIVRLPREAYLLSKAAFSAPLFDYELFNGIDEGKVESASDITVVHSRRMAKVGRVNISHRDPHMFMAITTDRGPVAIGEQLAQMMLGESRGAYSPEIQFHYSSEAQIFYQVDGEAFPLPGNAFISVQLGRQSLRFLAR